jgi:hypothetical protein
MRYVLASTLAAALTISGAALAQTKTGGTESSATSASPSMQQHETGVNAQQGEMQRDKIMTLQMVKEDLQNAGFTDIKVIADAFVVQAKDKDGNPTVMTLSPNRITAIEAIRSASNKPMGGSSSAGNSSAEHKSR